MKVYNTLQGEARAQRQSSAKLLFLIRINQSYAPRAFLVWPSNKIIIYIFFLGGREVMQLLESTPKLRKPKAQLAEVRDEPLPRPCWCMEAAALTATRRWQQQQGSRRRFWR